MKRFILSLAVTLISAIGFSQGCPDFAPGSTITKTAPGLYKLTVNYIGNGQKHLDINLFEGTAVLANLLTSTCIPTNGNGTASLNFVSLGNNPMAVVTPGTGNCGGGNSCTTSALTVAYVAAAPLPISISGFYAKRNSSTVLLSWATMSEINAKEFIIQKNAGNGFVDLKTIPAANRTNGASYTATDNNVSKGITLYRLKMVDFDGTFSSSDIRTVKGISSENDYTVYPNPAPSNSKISITDIAEPTDVQLIDNSGRVIKKFSMNNANSIDLNNVQNGVYQLRIQTRSSGSVATRKLTVAN